MHSIELHYFQWPWVTLTTPNHLISATNRHFTKTAIQIVLVWAQRLSSAYPTVLEGSLDMSKNKGTSFQNVHPNSGFRKFRNCNVDRLTYCQFRCTRQCDDLVTVVGHQFITMTVDICIEHGRWAWGTASSESVSGSGDSCHVLHFKSIRFHYLRRFSLPWPLARVPHVALHSIS